MHDLQVLLRRYNIHSAPVLEDGSCIGVVDGMDIAKFYFLNPSTFEARSKQCTVLHLLTSNATFIPVFAHTTLLDVVTVVAPGMHRAIVLHSESNHTLYSVCSESDIISMLYCYLTVDQNARPAQLISKLPICTFSNYLAHIKYHLHCDESLSTGVEFISKALQSTTTQLGVNDIPLEQQTTATALPLLQNVKAEVSAKKEGKKAEDARGLEWNAPIVVVIEGDHIISHLNKTIFHENIVTSADPQGISQHLSKTIKEYLNTFTFVQKMVPTTSLSPTPSQHSQIGCGESKYPFQYQHQQHQQPQQQQSSSQQQDHTDNLILPQSPTTPYDIISTPRAGNNPTTYNNNNNTGIGFVVKHTISLFNIIKLFAENKLDAVWVLTDEELFNQHLATYESISDEEQQRNTQYISIDATHPMPAMWYYQQELGIIALNDILRLLSRDNVWLQRDLLELYADDADCDPE